ncbi:uncharacterized protein LOC106073545 isoform X1 [Biomphalaria glabrata]|uniref:Uncharacterized protein LOC106073545 isoform X1 n=1 Tax=Biomphalaria glabrata TaxID=6526 RepID=A0A9W3ASK1_BIOGL|nr:uncharacterized protein LOC106073545 isoform X1 [Biomphalaria glabrata]
MSTIFLFFALVAGIFAQEKPGAILRLKQEALEYGSRIAPRILQNILDQATFENLEDKDGLVSYKFNKVSLEQTEIGNVKVEFDPSINGISVTLQNSDSSLSMDYESSIDMVLTTMQHSGSAQISLKDVDVDVKIAIEMDSDRIPTLRTLDCKASIRKCDFSFSSIVVHWMYSTMSKIIPNKLRQWTEEKFCRVISEYIDTKTQETIKSVKLHSVMDDLFKVDYSPLSKVSVSDRSIEAGHRGEVSWKSDSSRSNLKADDLPREDQDDENKMFNLWLEEYVAKTFAESAHSHDYLKARIAEDTISEQDQREKLRLSYASSLIPELSSNSPDSYLQVEVSSNKVPDVEISEEGVRIQLHGDVQVSSGSGSNSQQLFKLKTSVKLLARAHVEGNSLVPDILSYDVETRDLTQMQINPKEADALKFTHMIVREIAVKQIDKLARRGLPLMSLPDLRLVDPAIRFTNGSVNLATDAQYKDFD